IPAVSRLSSAPPAVAPLIVLCFTIAFEACRIPTPNALPVLTMRLFETVTLFLLFSNTAFTEKPSNTAPAPSMTTHPRVSQCQPAPEVTWPGTDRSTVPAGTPVLVASGNPVAGAVVVGDGLGVGVTVGVGVELAGAVTVTVGPGTVTVGPG